jgi:iron complex transport system ATP-binding protein
MTAIVTENLVVQRGGATLLDNLTLSLGPIGSIAIIGPNGAGKSTLLRTLAGIEAPTSGQIRIGDRDLSSLSGIERARAIGYVPQHFSPHWDLSVSELVRLGAERTGQIAHEMIDNALAGYELETLRHRRWSTLSGGERARTLLAMVLSVDPPVLLADEPAASLDIRHRLDVVRALAARGRDRLSVVVMHDLDLAFRFFEEVILLDRGRVVLRSSASEVAADQQIDRVFGVTFGRYTTEFGPHLHPR